MQVSFDSRAWMLAEVIQDWWEPDVQALWRKNKQSIADGLIEIYGQVDSETKTRNFVDFGRIPFSIVAFHNSFVEEIRNAFVGKAYYPALTGACALGERILNHMILLLRDDFRHTPHYKRLYSKDSFDNWELAIKALEAWDVLRPEAGDAFRELHAIRTRAIHFRPEVDANARGMALDAVKPLLRIVESQFTSGDSSSWFIQNTPGESFIAKAAEALPFIQRVYIPNCRLVGYGHQPQRRSYTG